MLGIIILIVTIGIQGHASEMKREGNSFKGGDSSKMVGGPCEYKTYRGKALILSIQKMIQDTRPDLPKKDTDSYTVSFCFSPDENIQETFVDIKREFKLLLKDSSCPDLGFIERNDIRPGKQLDCVLSVITKGSCTPILFSFPALK